MLIGTGGWLRIGARIKVLVKAGSTFVRDGHVARLAILEQAAFSEWADGSDGSDG